MPLIEVPDVTCPYCGDVAAVDIETEETEPQQFDCGECGDTFQVTWDPIKMLATVEGLPDDDEEELVIVETETDELDEEPDDLE